MKKFNLALYGWIFTTLLIVTGISSAHAQSSDNKNLSKLDRKIQTAFDALKAKNWKQAQTDFDDASKMLEKKATASELLFAQLSLLSNGNIVVTKNGVPQNVTKEVDDFRRVMGTNQALYEFQAFSAQLAGNSEKAEQYFNKTNEMRGVMWGKSWLDLIPQIHKLFYSKLTPETSENFGKYLLLAGRLLLNAGSSEVVKTLQEAKLSLPKDASVPALLASYFITHDNPTNAKTEARSSLSLNPAQPSVLIDLATAEWLLGEIDSAIKHANEAKKLNPNLPGPYATLAFAALEKDDLSTALKEAEIGSQLSNGHPFYQTILAAVLQASGKTEQAQKLFTEAWEGDLPNEELLKAWFFRGKVLEYIRKIAKK